MTKPKEISGIYGILNIENGKVYIGQSNNIKGRWSCHKSELRGGYHINKHLQSAWNKYGEGKFKFIVITEAPPTDLNDLECYWIKSCCSGRRRFGYNKNMGGQGVSLTEERKETIVYKTGKDHWHWGRKLSDETKARIGNAHRGMKRSPETCRRMSAAQSTPEARRKKSIASTGRKLSLEARMKMSVAATKRYSDPEERKKIGDLNRGRKASPAARKKMSEAHKKFVGKLNSFFGKKHADESRKKMSESAKKRIDRDGRGNLDRTGISQRLSQPK